MGAGELELDILATLISLYLSHITEIVKLEQSSDLKLSFATILTQQTHKADK